MASNGVEYIDFTVMDFPYVVSKEIGVGNPFYLQEVPDGRPFL